MGDIVPLVPLLDVEDRQTEGVVMDEHIYEQRIVAFGDILGWTDATRDASQVGSLEKTISLIGQYAGGFSTDFKKALEKTPAIPRQIIEEHANIEFCHFSDCFAVSAPIAHGKRVFGILSVASDKLLHGPKPFLVRGGVTVGMVCHRQGIIFGPALVEAVEIEHRAYYPRFLCSDKLVAYLDGTPYKHDVVFEDNYQQWAVNTAWGSLINRDELMKLLDAEIHSRKADDNMFRWHYIREVLPRMYDLKFKAAGNDIR
jgi:hypothetical protein